MEFLNTLREKIKQVGIDNVSDLSGTSRPYLFRMMKKDSKPSFVTIIKVCKALNIKTIKVE